MRILLVLPLVLALSACGKDDKKNDSQANASVVEGVTTGDCNQNVINDYNTVVNKCPNRMTRDQAKVCKKAAQDLLNKYPGLNCRAQSAESGQEMMIKAADVQAEIKRLEEQGI